MRERWRRGEGAGPVSKLNQRVSGFVMRKGRVSSCMEMPHSPAVSLRMWETQRDTKVKIIKPKCANCAGLPLQAGAGMS